jgi:hypothetical protein
MQCPKCAARSEPFRWVFMVNNASKKRSSMRFRPKQLDPLATCRRHRPATPRSRGQATITCSASDRDHSKKEGYIATIRRPAADPTHFVIHSSRGAPPLIEIARSLCTLRFAACAAHHTHAQQKQQQRNARTHDAKAGRKELERQGRLRRWGTSGRC